MKERVKYFSLCCFFACSGILLDQLTKKWAVDTLKDQPSISIIPHILELTYVENRGAAFGMMQGKQGFFLILTSIIILAILYILTRISVNRHTAPAIACLTVVFSGAVGNLIDRLTQGYVVDFIYFKPVDFPVFNVADIYVTLGMAVLMLLLLFYYKDEDLAELKGTHERKDKEHL